MLRFADIEFGSLFAPPRPLLRLGVHWLRSQAGRRLREPDGDLLAQRRQFQDLNRFLGGAELPRRLGWEKGLDYAVFRERVPLHSYEDLWPLIERMRAGEADLLAPGRCTHYAVSSGTTAGRTKYLPVNAAMIRHFRRAGLDSLVFYAHRSGQDSVFNGRHLFLGGSTALQETQAPSGFRSWSGDLSGITALQLPAWVERHLYEPGRDLALVADWPTKLEAIAARTRTRNVSLVAGIPSWLLILAEALLRGTPHSSVAQLWPQLECLIHGGVPIGPYTEALRAAFGAQVRFHEVFPASEGFIAAQDDEAEAGLRLMASHGLFFEFLPLDEYDEARRSSLGGRCLSLEEVQPDTDYALVLTTPGGLLRYLIGDVVRFTSVRPARIVYAGRTRLQLSAFGEHVSERDVTRALTVAAQEAGVQVAHFHVGPLFADAAAGRTRGAHHWCVELQPGQRIQSMDTFGGTLDRELMRINDDYEAKRLGGGLTPPVIAVLPSGTFEQWLRAKGKWGGQNKVPRCRSDRDLVDSLLSVKN